MPNRQTHVTVAVLAGVAATLHYTRNERPEDRAVELLGTLIGSYAGGRLPDVLDPPISPLHRSFAHGGLAVAGVAAARVEEWCRACRHDAALCAAQGRSGDRVLLLLLAGFLTGLRFGYGSHLALDFFTRQSLPLLGR
jgi:hypothetical protein